MYLVLQHCLETLGRGLPFSWGGNCSCCILQSPTRFSAQPGKGLSCSVQVLDVGKPTRNHVCDVTQGPGALNHSGNSYWRRKHSHLSHVVLQSVAHRQMPSRMGKHAGLKSVKGAPKMPNPIQCRHVCGSNLFTCLCLWNWMLRHPKFVQILSV